MRKRHIKQLISAKEYDGHVPGALIITSDPRWTCMHLSAFSLPNFLPEGPAPGLPNYGIGFLYSGTVTGEISINKGKWMPRTAVNKGAIDLWPRFSEVNWRWWPNENQDPIKIASIQLPAELLIKVSVEAMDSEPNIIELPNKLNISDPFMEQLLLGLINELERGNPLGQFYADTAAQMLTLHLLSRHCAFTRKNREYKQGLAKNQLLKVLDYINTYLDKDLSLDALALLTGMSAYHFLRQFKKSMNESPLQYIIRMRMEAAKQLLINSNQSITEIALDVGYENVSHFINLFKRQTGLTPLQYRRGF